MFDLTTKHFKETPLPLGSLATRKPGPLIVGKQNARVRGAENYRAKRTKALRLDRFEQAIRFSYHTDMPLNYAITITWSALIEAGEHNEGHCLGKGSWERERYLRKELARVARAAGYPFAALWGRDIGKDMGDHVHLSMFWPSALQGQLVAVLERVTGSSAATVLEPYTADTTARSICGGWQIDMNRAEGKIASSVEWGNYIATQHDKHPSTPQLKGKAFGISEAIGLAAQKRAGWT